MTASERRALAKVRTVTVFVHVERGADAATAFERVEAAAAVAERVEQALNHGGYSVQTARVVTNPYPDYLDTSSAEAAGVLLDAMLSALPRKTAAGAPFMFCIGAASTPPQLEVLPALLTGDGRQHVSASATIGADALGMPHRDMAAAAAGVMLELAALSDGGAANFQFCAASNMPPATPFLPAACWTGGAPAGRAGGVAGVALGLQHVELCVAVAARVDRASPAAADDVHRRLYDALVAELSAVVADVARVAAYAAGDVPLLGVDTSLAPAPLPHASVTRLYATLGVATWGAAGTLQASALLTAALKAVHGAPLVGYCGLMLPPMEDVGLAAAAADGAYRIQDLLMCSAVCGIGLDTVPIAGDVSADAVTALLCDVATLSHRLRKPLSARLFPVPGAVAGDVTAFDSPYMCNTRVFAL